MDLKAKNSIKGLKENGEYTLAGETFTTDKATGTRLVELGAAEEITEGAAESETEAQRLAAETAAARIELIANINKASSIEELKALEVPEDDHELVDLYEQRRDELTEPDH